MSKFIRGMNKNYIEISGQKKHETDRAILFFDGKKEIWLPKSQIEDLEERGKGVIIVTIPEWLAVDKELI